MEKSIRERMTFSNVAAALCLFVVLGGGAYAADKITSKDLAKNSVKSKAIKNGNVKAKDLKANAVNGEKIADGSVGGADIADGGLGAADLGTNSVGADEIAPNAVGGSELAPTEPPHLIGQSGEIPFSNGTEGDCIWGDLADDPSAAGLGLVEAGYFVDPNGITHLQGYAKATDGPGGDAVCGTDSNTSDNLMFVLPPSARSADLRIYINPVEEYPSEPSVPGEELSHNQILFIGDENVVSGPTTLVAGGVYASSIRDGREVVLDGYTFRASTPVTRRAADGSVELSPEAAERLGLEF